MPKLSEKDRERIIQVLESGEELPVDYKHVLFPPEKKEYELVYAGKEREEDILAGTMAVPLQAVKTFGKNGDGWTNKLIFGDNLQIMKALMDDPDVQGQVKLIYIDPPFATKQEFRGSQDQKAYQDKIAGAKFIEFLRKRLVFLRELLSEDGSIYVHLDQRKGHYIKILMDEIFKEEKFINEIIWCYTGPSQTSNYFPKKHEVILWYAKNKWVFNDNQLRIPYKKSNVATGSSSVIGRGSDKRLKELDGRGKLVEDWWSDIATIGYSHSQIVEYPTQKPEALIERIIKASTNKGNLILDAFAGSGTTLAVAEKLGRRWIGIDCGKLAIYTIQKRLLNLKQKIGNKGKSLKPKPFTLYTAGLYDFKQLKKLPWEEWRKFALVLFNCRDQKHKLSGIQLDGYRGRSDVLVFNHLKDSDIVLDYGFIEDLHSMIGSKVSREFFIIAPAARVMFLEDYLDKGSTRYYILRIPYSIINELHNRDFEAIKQPIDETQVNDTVDAVGFDFIRPPKVECVYQIKKAGDKSSDMASIKIKTFKSEAMLKGASQIPNRESLSMIMVDFDYNGDTFNLQKVLYASEIEKNNWEVHLPVESFKDKIMMIYLDIYGNEYREIKTVNDFKRREKRKKINA